MPQLSPMNWLMINFLSLLIFMMTNSFFNYFFSLKSLNFKNQITKKNKKWMW